MCHPNLKNHELITMDAWEVTQLQENPNQFIQSQNDC